jgi:hypothetical protein
MRPEYIICGPNGLCVTIYRAPRPRSVWGRAIMLTLCFYALLIVVALAQHVEDGHGVICEEANQIFEIYDQMGRWRVGLDIQSHKRDQRPQQAGRLLSCARQGCARPDRCNARLPIRRGLRARSHDPRDTRARGMAAFADAATILHGITRSACFPTQARSLPHPRRARRGH